MVKAIYTPMKAINTIKRIIQDEAELFDTLKELSKDGSAWIYHIIPFSHETTFKAYKNPSSVPDCFIDFTHGRMAWRGQLRGFTPSAKIREQNRGISCQ